VRIAYIVSRFPKISETFVADEIHALERRGFEVELLALVRHRESIADPGVAPLVERCRFVSPLSPGLWLAQLAWLARAPRALLAIWMRVLWEHRRSPRLLARAVAVVAIASVQALQLQRSGAAHVHAHWATHPALAAWVVHRLTGLSYSFTAHADDLFVQQTMLAEKARRAAFVVAISEYNRRFLTAWLGSAAPRIEVVHCGVATSRVRPRYGPEGGAFRIACVARLEEKKGQARLVDACADLVRRGIDVHCDLVGDGPQSFALAERIAALGLDDRVVLYGALPRERALSLVAAADAVALPCLVTAAGRRDGIPVALMEAMALGKPVVASRISGIPELIGHERSGLLVEPGDADALAEALSRLARDPAMRRRLGAAGRSCIEREFDLDRSAAQLGELFHGAVADAPTYARMEPLAASGGS
jgi:glycosyltransferase involved in cell wall biosynthesis